MVDSDRADSEQIRPHRLIVYGRPSLPFRALLPDAPVWRHFPGLKVQHARTRLQLLRLAWGSPTYVMPIWHNEAARCPHWWWMLRPNRAAIDTLHDKLRFARFVRAAGLDELAPRSFLDGEAPELPLVLKPARNTGGRGFRFIHDAAGLAAWRAGEDGKDLVAQERLGGDTDWATHVICRRGRVRWHCSYRYELGPGSVQTDSSIVQREAYLATAADLASFERFLVPLRYDGPAAIDWRRRPDGRIAVFEINPRFGGSLVRPENETDLAAGLQALLDNAVPRRRH